MIKKIDELTLKVSNDIKIDRESNPYKQSKFHYDYFKYYNDVTS